MKPLVALVTWNHFLRKTSWHVAVAKHLNVKYIFGFVLLSLASSLEKETTPLLTSNHEEVASLLASQKGICWEDHQLQRLRQMPEKTHHSQIHHFGADTVDICRKTKLQIDSSLVTLQHCTYLT